MSKTNQPSQLGPLGIKLTKLYLIALFGGIPILAFFGAIELNPITLNELGDFFAGAFGPLAIFWVVLGFFQQGEELRNSVDTLKLQADELRNSVEQQKTMVGITEKQLNLDIEMRRDQIRGDISKSLPNFQMRAGQGDNISDDRWRYKFHFKNIGAPAAEVKVILSGLTSGDFKFGGMTQGFIDEMKEFDFTITGPKVSTDDVDRISIDLLARNTKNNVRTQIYRFHDGAPILVNSDPET